MKRNNFVLPDAVAVIRGGASQPEISGTVRFYERQGSVLVDAHISGLPDSDKTGFFGFHIHEGDSCGGENFSDTGNHYNPENTSHPEHSGDLPPLLSVDGEARLAFLTNRFTVEEIIGKTVVIHSQADDFHTQPSGNAGAKIACGVITST